VVSDPYICQSVVYWVLAAKRLDKKYNIKQISNHKTYIYRPTKLQMEILIIRKSKANTNFFNLS